MNVAHQFNSERRDLEPPIYGFLAHVMRDDYQKHRLNMFMIALKKFNDKVIDPTVSSQFCLTNQTEN